ncbi:SPOR domain-containing protein [Pedobacter soli]|uniref:Sporulation related domain-containing protein n=1 Tax=Pedobacter soli TaxID=390242 RepID=A0A1G7BEQ8_9SPHI|nr:SPOR domain-containing protein [Pedobacter soli]SDE25544.1 Sporulation related domain-containing protein [Pedobacter soli]
MDILSYLLELLQQRKEVGITGLGTFYKKKYPGRYDKEKQTFLPPGYTLQFAVGVTEEKALTDFIAAKRNISAESAQYYIAQFVEEVNQKLELDHEIELENTGRLFFTEQGLDFEPIKNMNYGSEFYGLPSLSETAVEETQTTPAKEDEAVYDEIAEAPVAPAPFQNKSYQQPVIENVELDEVKDDLKNTLQHTEHAVEKTAETPASTVPDPAEIETPESEEASHIEEQHEVAVPEAVIHQHEEHPNRFGHPPESEKANKAAEAQEVEVPPAVVHQHEEHPDRFGHKPESEDTVAESPDVFTPKHQEDPNRFRLTPEPETPKTYIPLEEEAKPAESVIEAPAFIKHQHEEHPNRFGHDPIDHDTQTAGMSTWLKVVIIALIIIIAAAITYLVKPELFNGQSEPAITNPVTVDSPKVAVDTLKAKQDSIAKTDSILKANQVQKKADTLKKTAPKVTPVAPKAETTPAKPETEAKKTGPATFEVIGASFGSVEKAEQYIKTLKKVGINAKIAKMPGKRQNVSLGTFTNEKEAVAQKDLLQKKLKGKGYYVQQIFNNTQP